MLDTPTAPDVRALERYCEDMARREAANFYWGFIALPRRQRTSIYALYDFARQVDDDADLDGRGSRDERLEHHRRRLLDARPGDSTDPIMGLLAIAMRRHAIPMAELDMLIDGVAMDLSTTRYRTWDELRAYANLVASAVGRMCVRIFGFRDPIALVRADELGVALQLINILRDVREDAARGRIYLPLDELAAFGITENHILDGHVAPGWRAFMTMQIARARQLHASGIRVTASIPRQPAVCVHTMAGIYLGILDRIEAAPELPLRGRARLSKAAKLGVVARSWLAAV
ncbi:MAG: phytoene/squalene synthase family protein [Candidatus Dormibacteria bacterium]